MLARKWRPRDFSRLGGQETARRILENALASGRVHQAYLFTGTRGVGKTTIARIVARCLNCENNGVSARPCGQCSACQEIDRGTFLDLIEVDAASRTKVEDTRDLLENARYAPTRGRYKVYLIDEVHMLSTSSFNALLKTLEEPPAHSKFLLATTDPQKIPVTILSRCLQFHLKTLSAHEIVQQLEQILTAENITFEERALWVIARAAAGSMRDALSITEQAIAYTEGNLIGEALNTMLGFVDHDHAGKLLQWVDAQNATELFACTDQLRQRAIDHIALLDDLLTLIQRIAIAQATGQTHDETPGQARRIAELAQKISPETLQLYYQIGIEGKKDLACAPDPHIGLEMILLRMIAFHPVHRLPTPSATPSQITTELPAEKNATEKDRAVSLVDTETERKETLIRENISEKKFANATRSTDDSSIAETTTLQTTTENTNKTAAIQPQNAITAVATEITHQDEDRTDTVIAEQAVTEHTDEAISQHDNAAVVKSSIQTADITPTPAVDPDGDTPHAIVADSPKKTRVPPASATENFLSAADNAVKKPPRSSAQPTLFASDQPSSTPPQHTAVIAPSQLINKPRIWDQVIDTLPIDGTLEALLRKTIVRQIIGGQWYMQATRDSESQWQDQQLKEAETVLSQRFCQTVQLHISVDEVQHQSRSSVSDPRIDKLAQTLGATVIPNS